MFDQYHLQPLDPKALTPDWDRLTDEEREQVCQTQAAIGCASYAVVIILGLLLCALFGSCTPQRIVSEETTDRRTTELMQRMDSVLHVTATTRQDSTWRQEILRQFQSIRESSDTSRTVVQDTAGNVIRERIVINNVRESVSQSEREEREVMMHRLEVMDSTLSVMQQSLQRSDSLLQAKSETRIEEVAAPLSGWQTFRLWIGNIVLALLGGGAVVWIFWRHIKSRLHIRI